MKVQKNSRLFLLGLLTLAMWSCNNNDQAKENQAKPNILWIIAEDLSPEDLKRDGANALPKLHGALLKNEQDVHLFERLAFMARGQR